MNELDHQDIMLRISRYVCQIDTPMLLQDECKGLSSYLSNAPHARLHAKEAVAAIQESRTDHERHT